MPDGQKDLEAVKATILAEFNAQGFGDEPLSFRKAMELREYAKARTDLHSENLTMEQAIWKSLYEGVTEELRKASPEWMTEIESLEKRRDYLSKAQAAMSPKLKANPHDFGVRVWWGFVIIGVLVGWMRGLTFRYMAVFGFVFWIAGLFFCIFALDSAEVQSKLAIFLSHRLGARRISLWLYKRALMIR
jgi:hypothetical protein